MEPTSIAALLSGAMQLLKTGAELSKSSGDANSQAMLLEFQEALIKLNADAVSVQTQNRSLLRENADLKQALKDINNWDDEKGRYAMVSPWQGAVTLALKREKSNGQPPHWICSVCYEEGKKSILNDHTESPARGRRTLALRCPSCKSQIPTAFSGGSIERKYAEDVTNP